MSIRVRDYLLAVEDAQLARLAAPRDPRGCSLEGAAQLGLGEVVRARECFLAGLHLDPRSQFMQSGLKATRQMLGDVSPELAEDPELEQVEEGDEDQEGANEVAAARQLDEPCGDDTLDMAEITSPEGDKREQAEKTYEPQEEEGGFDDDTESLREYDAEITREASQAESLPTDQETEHVEVEKLSVADSADESSHRVAEKFASDAPSTTPQLLAVSLHAESASSSRISSARSLATSSSRVSGGLAVPGSDRLSDDGSHPLAATCLPGSDRPGTTDSRSGVGVSSTKSVPTTTPGLLPQAILPGAVSRTEYQEFIASALSGHSSPSPSIRSRTTRVTSRASAVRSRASLRSRASIRSPSPSSDVAAIASEAEPPYGEPKRLNLRPWSSRSDATIAEDHAVKALQAATRSLAVRRGIPSFRPPHGVSRSQPIGALLAAVSDENDGLAVAVRSARMLQVRIAPWC